MGFQINQMTQDITDQLPKSIDVNPADQTVGLKTNAAITPSVFVFNGIVLFLWLISIVTVISFIYAGIKYMTAGGDAEKAESAKKVIIGSIIGMIIIIASYTVFRFAVNVLNDTGAAGTTQGVQKLMSE